MPSEQYGLYFMDDDLYPIFVKIVQKYFSEIKFTKFAKLVVDIGSKDEQLKIVQSYHHSPQNHRGISETETRLSKNFYWPNMREAIQDFIINCEMCNVTKYDRNPIKLKLNKTPTPTRPFHTAEQQNFLIIVDAFSKYGQAYPIQNKTGLEVMDKLFMFFTHHRCVKKVIFDQGLEFLNRVVDFLNFHRIEIHSISHNHPNSQGIIERFHSTIAEHLKLFKLNPDYKDVNIVKMMQMAVLAYNNSYHSVTKMTAFQIVNCHNDNPALAINDDVMTSQDYVDKQVAFSKLIYEKVHNRIEDKKEKVLEKVNKKRENAPVLKQPIFRKLVKRIANQKTSPRFQVSKITKVNKDRGTLGVVNPKTQVKQKIHLDQVKRPKKNQGSLIDPEKS